MSIRVLAHVIFMFFAKLLWSGNRKLEFVNLSEFYSKRSLRASRATVPQHQALFLGCQLSICATLCQTCLLLKKNVFFHKRENFSSVFYIFDRNSVFNWILIDLSANWRTRRAGLSFWSPKTCLATPMRQWLRGFLLRQSHRRSPRCADLTSLDLATQGDNVGFLACQETMLGVQKVAHERKGACAGFFYVFCEVTLIWQRKTRICKSFGFL